MVYSHVPVAWYSRGRASSSQAISTSPSGGWQCNSRPQKTWHAHYIKPLRYIYSSWSPDRERGAPLRPAGAHLRKRIRPAHPGIVSVVSQKIRHAFHIEPLHHTCIVYLISSSPGSGAGCSPPACWSSHSETVSTSPSGDCKCCFPEDPACVSHQTTAPYLYTALSHLIKHSPN